MFLIDEKGLEGMASKHKITAYISDSTTYEWAKNTATERDLTKSGFLESLIKQEMQLGRSRSKLRPALTIYDTYHPPVQMLTYSGNYIIGSSIPNSSPVLEVGNLIGMITDGVNMGIHNDFHEKALGHYIRRPQGVFDVVFLKTFFEGRVYEDPHVNSVNVSYNVIYLPLIITQEVWDEYGGCCDFFSIRYLRQTDIVRSEWKRSLSGKYTGIMPLFERMKYSNDVGGFFIPVYQTPKKLEDRLEGTDLGKKRSFGNNFFMGVGPTYKKERFCLKGSDLLRNVY